MDDKKPNDNDPSNNSSGKSEYKAPKLIRIDEGSISGKAVSAISEGPTPGGDYQQGS